MDFIPFPKLARLNRDIVITEKIDGTNAQIHFDEDMNMRVGSRKRWITPEDDNFGFARWAFENEEELRQLGPGSHFGEWWGGKIQRGYNVEEKRFSLFNTHRWVEDRPACCSVVPVIYQGAYRNDWIEAALFQLKSCGSKASPGFMNPEGIVIYHTAARQMFKVTLENDEVPKSLIK